MDSLDNRALPAFAHITPRARTFWPAAATVIGLLVLSGCAAFTNPVANGIPVRLLPPEALVEPREDLEPIPLACLKRKPPEKYLLQPGDVLSVFIEGVLGQTDQPPPVNIAEGVGLPPSLGFPVPVREDGTLPLPLIDPVPVQGKTIGQAEKAIVQAFTAGAEPILQPGRARILVTLLRPKLTRVHVIRQDTPAGGIGGIIVRDAGVIRSTRQFRGGADELFQGRRGGGGISTVVELPGYENDVLTALAYTGGLPGPDALNEIRIERPWGASAEPGVPGPAPCPTDLSLATACGQITRIPLRLNPCDPIPFRPEDVILHDGDVIYIEARDADVFYTGGLLPSGEFPLPRDYDLDVIEAIAAVGGPLVNGGINSNNLTGQIVQPGIGNPSPRLVTVLRRVPGRGQIPIQVDLNLALRDPRESLILAPGDVIILQEARDQALARYFSNVFNFTIVSRVIQTSRTTGTTTLGVP